MSSTIHIYNSDILCNDNVSPEAITRERKLSPSFPDCVSSKLVSELRQVALATSSKSLSVVVGDDYKLQIYFEDE